MGLRNMLREWLGINELAGKGWRIGDQTSDNFSPAPDPEPIRRSEILDAMEAVLNNHEVPTESAGTAMAAWIVRTELRDRLQQLLDAAVERKAWAAAEAIVDSRINREQFVDDVVDRIQRKQLPKA